MTRHDVHRPAGPLFDPQKYDLVGVWDRSLSSSNGRTLAHIEVLKSQGYKQFGTDQNCGHCGTAIRYSAVLKRDDVKQFIHVGEVCLDNRFPLSKEEFQRLRKAAQLDAKRRKMQESAADYILRHPEIAGMVTSEIPFVKSVYGSLQRYGSLTMRQYEAVKRALERPVVEDKPAEPLLASESQVAFIMSLLKSREVPAEVIATIDHPQSMDRKRASATIDYLKSFPYKKIDLEVGGYRHDGVFYRVAVGRQSRVLQAYRFDPASKSFVYDRAALNILQPEDMLSIDEACEFGVQSRICIICGAPLEDEQSVRRGIGPVCYSRMVKRSA